MTGKGKDSINYGIQLMQEFEILVTKRSTNLINELQRYMWRKEKDGQSTNVPIDAFNHCIDAARYACVMKLSKDKEWYNPFDY